MEQSIIFLGKRLLSALTGALIALVLYGFYEDVAVQIFTRAVTGPARSAAVDAPPAFHDVGIRARALLAD